MPDILISENIRGAAVDALARKYSVEILPELWKDQAELLKKVVDAKALIVRNQTQVKADVFAAAKNLKVVGRAGVGLDNVDVAAATAAKVVVACTPDQNAISVAELAMGLLLSVARLIPQANSDTKTGNWNRQKFFGTELYGKTFAIVGAGKIGILTARRAMAFGMKILAYDPYLGPDNTLLADLGAKLVGIDELLANADVVSCHLPATATTEKFFNAEKFGKMKSNAIFINTSRGEVVDEVALAEALKSKKIAGAGLDVRAKEPPVAGELETLDNLVVTPHTAAFTAEAQLRVTNSICEDVGLALEGKPVRNPVNKI
jgi:D-3-phosphoglycerate dehydrogenase